MACTRDTSPWHSSSWVHLLPPLRDKAPRLPLGLCKVGQRVSYTCISQVSEMEELIMSNNNTRKSNDASSDNVHLLLALPNLCHCHSQSVCQLCCLVLHFYVPICLLPANRVNFPVLIETFYFVFLRIRVRTTFNVRHFSLFQY